MANILTSASKIVFITLALTACIAFIWNIVTGKVVLETKDFMLLASMAFSFYFANKGETSPKPENPDALPYAGK